MIKSNTSLIKQLRREGYRDEDILAICKDETIGLNENQARRILSNPECRLAKSIPLAYQGIRYSPEDVSEGLSIRCNYLA